MNIFLYIYLFVLMLCQHSSMYGTEVVTNPVQYDGFGSQLQVIIASVVYAELTNRHFVYSPFEKMEHNYNGSPYDREFLDKKEELINFKNNFEVIDKNKVNNVYKIHAGPSYKDYFDANILKCAQSRALTKIRQIFKANKKVENYFNNECMNIAVHVRRPNSHDNRSLGTDTPDDFFINVIQSLRNTYADKNPLFHLYSQGKSENFVAFNAPDIVLHLNESIEDTFTGMVVADVLVMSASSFSYAAGLLSEGIVYYISFWHAPLPHWVKVT